jgi:hypothetical protein
MCLLVVAAGAINRERQGAIKTLRAWELKDELTPEERRFLMGWFNSEESRIQLSWRGEAVLPLLWAVRIVDELPYPDEVLDMDWLASLWRPTRSGWWEDFQTRPANEILDETDLILRYNWAVRNAMLKQLEPPAGLHPGVVMERHHALNWLVGYGDQAWDDVTTDT